MKLLPQMHETREWLQGRPLTVGEEAAQLRSECSAAVDSAVHLSELAKLGLRWEGVQLGDVGLQGFGVLQNEKLK